MSNADLAFFFALCFHIWFSAAIESKFVKFFNAAIFALVALFYTFKGVLT